MSTSPDERSGPEQAGTSRQQKPRSKSRRRPQTRLNRNAPLHQARVFAMQSLYEVDVTGHEIDEVQRHLGTPRRSELESFFQLARRSARTTLSTISFLARSTDRTNPESALAAFQAASQKAVDEWIEQPADEDADVADAYTTFARGDIEGRVRTRIQEFRDQAESTVSAWLEREAAESTLDQDAKELQEDLGEFSDVAGRAAEIERLELLERSTLRAIEDLLAEHERQALESLLEMLRHAERLSRGVNTHQAEIDERIAVAAPAFPIAQLASIDRAVLRIALQELLHEPEVPYRAVINEAVDIAKQYGGPNSGRFVNGVLRTISEQLYGKSGPKRS